MPQEWKYNTLHLTKPISENKLKQMGNQNWELVGCTTQNVLFNPNHALDDRIALRYIYYFKMPKETAFP